MLKSAFFGKKVLFSAILCFFCFFFSQNGCIRPVLVDGNRHGTGYVTTIVYCLYIMQMIAEFTNQSL